MKLNSFMDKWERSIPSGMRADLQMLEGEVLYEKRGTETWVHAFRVADLPLTPAERFAALFLERPRWEWKDLQPYIRYNLSQEFLFLYSRILKHTTKSSSIVEFSCKLLSPSMVQGLVRTWRVFGRIAYQVCEKNAAKR
jgi:hypothetical protein